MTRKIEVKSVGAVKVYQGELRIYRDHNLIAAAELTNRMRLQLIAELTDELRYPQQDRGG